MAQTHDLIIIGGGPGGYVAAIRAAQLGLNVACVEKEPTLGGTCLRVGCIPSKALLESSERFHEAHELAVHGVKVGEITLDLRTMMKRKERIVATLAKGIEGLLKKNKVTRYSGTGKVVAVGRVQVVGKDTLDIEAKRIIIATGSRVAPLKGVATDGNVIGTSTEALAWDKVPEHLVVIGAGVIGLELGSVWARLGAKVTVLEYFDFILPGIDREVANAAQKILEKQGLVFRLGTRVTGAKLANGKAEISVDGQPSLTADRVLVATGRLPNTDNLGLDELGIKRDKRGTIDVNDHFETAVSGIYAIGDCIRGPMLAHKAEDEGMACVEHIVTGYGHVNYNAIPGVVYTNPEIAAVGRTEEQLAEAGITYRKGSFPFMANGRARSLEATEGFVKILADATTDAVLGVHIIGARAGDLIAEAVAAMEFGASSEDIARTCHAHPSLSEAVKEAALGVDGRIIHM